MRDWPLIRIAIGREYRAWRRPFLISSAVIVVLVGVALGIATAVAGETTTQTLVVATAGDTPDGFGDSVAVFLPEDAELRVERFATGEAARAAAAAGEADVAVIDDDVVVWGDAVTDALGDGVVETLVLAQIRRRAEDAGVAPDDVERLLRPQIDFSDANPAPIEDSNAHDEEIAVFSTIIMFVAIIAYGQWIGYAVVEEKANRVVEVLLGAIRPHQLMTAKVVSIGSLGLAQVAGVGAVLLAYGLATDGVGFPEVRGSTVGWVVLWFFLGYAFYGSLYAAAGSLASNTQEAGSTIGPLAIFLVVGYMSGLISFGEGYDTLWLQIISHIPLWSPLVMPGRVVRGWATPLEALGSVAIMVLAIYAMLRLAGWIYTGGVARATQKLGWREALRTGRELGAR